MQWLQWSQVKWAPISPAKVWYECEKCLGKIEEQMKPWFLERGEWRPTAEDKWSGKKRGFGINGLFPPNGMLSWGKVVQEYNTAKADQSDYKAWLNNYMGETWEGTSSVKVDSLLRRLEPYTVNPLPAGVSLITGGIDPNDHETCVELVGWGPGKESWGLGYYKLKIPITQEDKLVAGAKYRILW